MKSNHPPSFIEQLPKIVNKSISELSFDESEFNNAKVIYKLALKHSGYNSEMKFDQKPSTRKNRNRKIICFNLPFRQNVKTDIGKLFFKVVQKNFSKNHTCRKIMNLNTLKLSYSSMANLQSLIKRHFYVWKCLAKCIVYKAEVATAEKYALYHGTSDGQFKTECWLNSKWNMPYILRPTSVVLGGMIYASKKSWKSWRKILRK